MLSWVHRLARWPLWALHGLGALGGWGVWLMSPSYRRVWRAQTQQAGLSGWARWSSIAHAGMQVAEMPRIWLGQPVPWRWEGAGAMDRALLHGQGLLFLTPHLGCFELTARAYAASHGAQKPITVMFRPPRKAALDEVLAQARSAPGLNPVPASVGGIKHMLKALKAGHAVGLLPDQVPPDGLGQWAPWFGRDAYTMTLPAKLAAVSPSPVLLLAWGERLPWGRGYVVHVRPWAESGEPPLSADPVQAAQQLNRAMQWVIGQCPAQYLWGYPRYKPPRAMS